MKTRKGIVTVVIILILLLPSVTWAGGGKEAPKTPGRPYEGVTVKLGLLARGLSDALKPYLEKFKAETGITAVIEQHAFDSLRDKMMIEFAAKSGYFDIIYLSPGYLGELVENDYIMPLNDYMKRLGFRSDDFLPAAIEISRYGSTDEIWGFPYLADTSILMYRKDLFQDSAERAAFKSRFGYDLPIPTVEKPLTTSEFLDIAKFFTRDTNKDGKTDMYGFGYPQIGVAYGNLYIMPWIWTFGGDYFDKNYKATVNSPKALAAMKYAKELQQYQPDGVLGWEYGNHIPRFYEGHLAMTAGWFGNALDANNPAKSKVAGKVGYAPVPWNPESGLKTGKAVLGGGSLAIAKHSKNPEAAFTYLNWMFGNEERALEWYLNGGSATLKKIYESPKVHDKFPWAKEFFAVANHSLANIATQRPTIGVSHSIFEVMSGAWHNVALGRETPEAALSRANSEMQAILDKWRKR